MHQCSWLPRETYLHIITRDARLTHSLQDLWHLQLFCMLYVISAIYYHPQSSCGNNFVSVCLSVCQTITFESLDIECSFSLSQYISRGYGSSSYVKVIGSRSRSHEQKTWNVILPPLCLSESMTTTAETESTLHQWGVAMHRWHWEIPCVICVQTRKALKTEAMNIHRLTVRTT